MRLFSVIFKHCVKIANDRLQHDIALIMLKQSLDFEMVESIKIGDKISQAKDCYTLGYNDDGTLIKSLASILTQEKCQELIHNYWADQIENLGECGVIIYTLKMAIDFDSRVILSFRSPFLTLRFSLKIKSLT